MLLLFLACNTDPCPLWYTDLDGDGFGAGGGVRSCQPLKGRSLTEGDCTDRDASIHPGALDPPEDGLDQDCSGDVPCSGAVVQDDGPWECGAAPIVISGSLVNPESDPSCLCSVGGDLRLSETSASDFTALQSVGGTLRIMDQVDPKLTLPSLVEVGALHVDGLERLHLPALGSAAILRAEGLHALELPALREAGLIEVQLTGPELDLPALVTVQSLYADHVDTGFQRVLLPELNGGQTLETPRLEKVWDLSGADSTLPDLWQVNRSSYDGVLPALSVVEAYLSGAPTLPALRILHGAAEIQTTAESLPALTYADQDLRVIGEAWLPALRSVNGSLFLQDSASFHAPALQSVERITLRGDTTAELPDPLPWGLRLEEWAPSAPVKFGALQAGLAIVDSDFRSTAFKATSVAGNVEIDAPSWLDVPLSFGPIGGELRYCLTSVAEEDLNAWLAEQDVAGEQVNTCP